MKTVDTVTKLSWGDLKRTFQKMLHHCVHCGARDVWAETGEGDYYAGAMNVCATCGCSFTWQDSQFGGGLEEAESIVAQIKAGR